MLKVLKNSETGIVLLVIFLLPLLTLPIASNVFIIPKIYLLVVGIIALIVVRAVRTVITGKLNLYTGSFDIAVIGILIAYTLGAYFKTPNRMEALLLPGTATIVIASGLLYFFVNQIQGSQRKLVSYSLIASASVLSLIVLLSATGAFANIGGNYAYMGAKTFSPMGGYLPTAIFLIGVAPLVAGIILSKTAVLNKVAVAIAGAFLVFGIGFSLFKIAPGQEFYPKLPSNSQSWVIAVDSLKESPLLGVGPGNYLTAFNKYRPISYNASDLWAVKFSTASNFYFTSLTETGLVGLIGILFVIFIAFKLLKHNYKSKNATTSAIFNIGSLILVLAMILFFPSTINITCLLFILMSLSNSVKKTTFNLKAKSASDGFGNNWPAIVAIVPVLVVLAVIGYRSWNVAAAEYDFRKALEAITKNEASIAYETMRKAISKNPLVDRYHSNYAQINLAIANGIARQSNEQGELTEEQRQQITQLIQQSIRESRTTVALNPHRSENWLVLARTYQAIIPLTEGADSFAAQSYAQAVALDPINPNTRIALGSLFYSAKNYETAIKVLELAVAVKNDHPNAHYNLAYALKESGNIERAIQEMSIVVSLTEQTSKDYQIAQAALEEFKNAAKEAEPATGDELTAPEDTQDKLIQPPVELTEDDQPPAEVITPTPVEVTDEGVTISPAPSPTPAP